MGRCGVKVIKGLRVAYVSGVDSDLCGNEVRNADYSKHYLGNMFNISDIKDGVAAYMKLVERTGIEGVDLLLTGQWPLNISGSISDPDGELEQ